jgi:hypothetical protein
MDSRGLQEPIPATQRVAVVSSSSSNSKVARRGSLSPVGDADGVTAPGQQPGVQPICLGSAQSAPQALLVATAALTGMTENAPAAGEDDEEQRAGMLRSMENVAQHVIGRTDSSSRGSSSGSGSGEGGSGRHKAVERWRYLYSLDVRRLSLAMRLLPGGGQAGEGAVLQTQVHAPVPADGG